MREISKDQIPHGLLDYGCEFAFCGRHPGKSLKGFKPENDMHVQAAWSGEEAGRREGRKEAGHAKAAGEVASCVAGHRAPSRMEGGEAGNAGPHQTAMAPACPWRPPSRTDVIWTHEPQPTGFWIGRWCSSPAFPSPDNKDPILSSKPKTHSLSKLRKCIANLPSLTHDTMVFSSSRFHG